MASTFDLPWERLRAPEFTLGDVHFRVGRLKAVAGLEIFAHIWQSAGGNPLQTATALQVAALSEGGMNDVAVAHIAQLLRPDFIKDFLPTVERHTEWRRDDFEGAGYVPLEHAPDAYNNLAWDHVAELMTRWIIVNFIDGVQRRIPKFLKTPPAPMPA